VMNGGVEISVIADCRGHEKLGIRQGQQKLPPCLLISRGLCAIRTQKRMQRAPPQFCKI